MPYAAVLLDDGSRVLLGRQYGGYPCPPGGRVEGGETPEQAAVREVREEAGVAIDPADLLEIGQVTHTGKTNAATHHGWWYAARTWRGQPVNVEPAKCEGWIWYAYDELPSGMDDYTAAVVNAYLRLSASSAESS